MYAQALERRELEAIPRRLDEIENRVVRQREVEKQQQERYKELVSRRDDLKLALAKCTAA